MAFYSSIAGVYDYIFPYNEFHLSFIADSLPNDIRGKSLLDVGCGTGSLAINAQNAGMDVIAIDPDPKMIAIAQRKANDSKISFIELPMQGIRDIPLPHPKHFDCITCLGNTLVHAKDLESILQFFVDARNLLKPSGTFIIQILNYDYILSKKIHELPFIENDHISFRREYIFKQASTYIEFKTELLIKESQQRINNQVPLIALGKTKLNQLLMDAGFESIQYFSSYTRLPYDTGALPLLAECKA